MFTREKLIEALHRYHSDFSEERDFREAFLTLLQHPRCFFRDHMPGHITASAWIIDEQAEFILLTLHAKLNRWLQPGGHADGDENVLGVALREVEEETGLKGLKPLQESVFDIDVHTIPARKDFPEHLHYDVRFLFRASREEPLIITSESHALAWKHVSDLPQVTANNDSMLRMAAKVKKLF